MKKFYIIILLAFSSCTNGDDNKTVSKPDKKTKANIENNKEKKLNAEDLCISLVQALPEVQNLAIAIETTTKLHNHLTLWVAAHPSETKIKYYWVKVGEDNGENIVTHLNFYVDPKLEVILFYDVVNDTLVSLEYWREQLNKN